MRRRVELALVVTMMASFPVRSLVAEAGSAQDRPAVARLPGGGEIALVAVSRLPRADQPWWRPNGAAASKSWLTTASAAQETPGTKVRQFVLRVSDLPEGVTYHAPQVQWAWPHSVGYGEARVERDAPTGDLEVVVAAVPEGCRSVTVTVPVVMGPWETIASESPEQRDVPAPRNDGDGPRAVFDGAREVDGDTQVVVSHNVTGVARRVTALGHDGETHVSDRIRIEASVPTERLTTVFPDLPSAQIKAFRLQTSPFTRVEFRNVSLDPGIRTEVEAAVVPGG